MQLLLKIRVYKVVDMYSKMHYKLLGERTIIRCLRDRNCTARKE